MVVVAAALAELRRWSGLLETMPAGEALVKGYWRDAAQWFPGVAEPWSGVFVSAVANRVLPGALKKAQAHTDYAAQAYRDRGTVGTYGALTPAEAGPLQAGDILIRPRAGETVAFDDLKTGIFRPTHGDFVVSVTPAAAQLVGGNVRNAVSENTEPLTAARLPPTSQVFAVLRYQAPATPRPPPGADAGAGAVVLVVVALALWALSTSKRA